MTAAHNAASYQSAYGNSHFCVLATNPPRYQTRINKSIQDVNRDTSTRHQQKYTERRRVAKHLNKAWFADFACVGNEMLVKFKKNFESWYINC